MLPTILAVSLVLLVKTPFFEPLNLSHVSMLVVRELIQTAAKVLPETHCNF